MWRIRDHVHGRVLSPSSWCLSIPHPPCLGRVKACFPQEIFSDLVHASRGLILHDSFPFPCSTHADLVLELGPNSFQPQGLCTWLSGCLKCSSPELFSVPSFSTHRVQHTQAFSAHPLHGFIHSPTTYSAPHGSLLFSA